MAESLRILVVDDERLSRETTAKLLEGDGYFAKPVENARVALERLGERGAAWDLVLTDLRMPGMNGIDFLKELKRRALEIDVILMTAYGSAETSAAAMDAGVSDLLTKPFSYRELEWRIRRIATNRARDKEIARLREIIGRHGISSDEK